MKILTAQEIKAILNLPPNKRYEHFIKQVADWGNVWTLYNSADLWIIQDQYGNSLLPVFPHQEYAELFAQKNFKTAITHSIEVHNFMEEVLTALGDRNIAVSVLPTSRDSGFIVSHSTLYNDITKELSKIE